MREAKLPKGIYALNSPTPLNGSRLEPFKKKFLRGTIKKIKVPQGNFDFPARNFIFLGPA